MLITEAVQIGRTARLSESAKVPLVCSFEPLNLKTYAQAFLTQRFPDNTPEVLTFGYDRLSAGLVQTASAFKTSPALLFLSWEDIHPGLSWRSRGRFGGLDIQEIINRSERLKRELLDWIAGRDEAETYIAAPSEQWLPLHDPCSPLTFGESTLGASMAMKEIVFALTRRGGRVLRLPELALGYRDLLQAGCPLSLDGCEIVAKQFVTLAFPMAERKKVLITDLDGTLWSGRIGEDGSTGIHCGHDGVGWPYHVFHKFLLKLKREGILLAFCSKNNPHDVLPFFDSLDAPLKLSDFAAFRCNWDPKSSNIRSMAQELNLGCDALVVVDDDEAELAEIRRHLPESTIFSTPRDGKGWLELFSGLQDLFCTWHVNGEDRLRTDSVLQERQRRAFRSGSQGNLTAEPHRLDYLRDLNLELTICLDAFSDRRSLELINKTNQFNLTGERLSQQEWLEWAASPGAFCVSAKLKDRFGEFGTICVVTGHKDSSSRTVFVRQFVLSCRAFGRGVEMLVLGELLKDAVWDWVCGPFKGTNRNEPARMFLGMLGCEMRDLDQWKVSTTTLEQAAGKVLQETGAKVTVVAGT